MAAAAAAAAGARVVVQETCSAPTNIAVIKYWGKKDRALNTPINSSVSVTLEQDDLRAVTTVAASKAFDRDRLWLNGTEEDISGNKRMRTCLAEVRRLAQDRVNAETGEVEIAKEDWPDYHVHIVSVNTFPTAAGLASSAAGFACLVFALGKLFNAKETYEGELSAIARQGSGSACRSLFGGFAEWRMGERADGRDSHGIQVADEHHWPELRALIMVVSDAKKDTSSTSGMMTSVETSELLRFRAENVVEPRLSAIKHAYWQRDFDTFGRITMQDSNQFHATCLDTYPPIFYMNDISRNIIRIVTAYNEYCGEVRAAYTFDAGPNAVIYTLDSYLKDLFAIMLHFYPPRLDQNPAGFCNNPDFQSSATNHFSQLPGDLLERLEATAHDSQPGDVKYVYVTRAGGGPRQLPPEECLMDLTTGGPSAAAMERYRPTSVGQQAAAAGAGGPSATDAANGRGGAGDAAAAGPQSGRSDYASRGASGAGNGAGAAMGTSSATGSQPPAPILYGIAAAALLGAGAFFFMRRRAS